MTDAVIVRLLGVPQSLLERNRRQTETIRREFQLIELGEKGGDPSPPARLLSLGSTLLQAYEGLGLSEQIVSVPATAAGGTEAEDDVLVNLELPIPQGGDRVVRRLRQAMDEADEWCQRGELLTLITPPDCRALREWVFDQIVRQLAGEVPTPWKGL